MKLRFRALSKPVPTVPLTAHETREREVHRAAAIGVRCAMGLWSYMAERNEVPALDALANADPHDRRTVLNGMRAALADPEGCGSRYCHVAACAALDSATRQPRGKEEK
jgi:hypothetical protein